MRLFMALLVAVLSGVAASAAHAGDDGFYLHWNVDHTDRAPRPMYALAGDDARVLDSYFLDYDGEQLVSVKFFHAGKPSPHGDYGAHELVRVWTDMGLVERYRNAAGERVANSRGVWETRYLGSLHGFWAERVTIGPDGNPVDAGGYATMIATRDAKGRRIREVRYTAAGEQVNEHNGFATASFGFDDNDFATYRRYELADGSLRNGAKGYAEVRFQFDDKGNFLSEQVFGADGERKNFPAGYASVSFSNFDAFGNPRRVELATETGAPFGAMPVIRRVYTPAGQRECQRYYNQDGTPGHDENGVHEVRYHYDDRGARTHTSRFDISGNEVQAD